MSDVKIITVDGPAASGKGTLARKLADHLGYFYLDTGKIYRLIGLQAAKQNLVPEEQGDNVANIARDLAQKFDFELLNDPELKSDHAGQMASRASQYPPVRDAVLELQRELAKKPPNGAPGAVLDGRDCGTVICPQAPHKFFIIADMEVRAKRRHEELKSAGDDISYEAVLKDMEMRDHRDTKRTTAPLKPAEDAIIIDTTILNPVEAYEKVLQVLER